MTEKTLFRKLLCSCGNHLKTITISIDIQPGFIVLPLNVAISFYRKENRRRKVSNPLSESILNFAETNATGETDENIGFLQQFISELKEIDKALMLLYLEEKSHKEIAEIIGITETNVATKIGRIKAGLKQQFSLIKKQ